MISQLYTQVNWPVVTLKREKNLGLNGIQTPDKSRLHVFLCMPGTISQQLLPVTHACLQSTLYCSPLPMVKIIPLITINNYTYFSNIHGEVLY